MATTLHAALPVNAIPAPKVVDNTTGCCPRFDPRPWDGQELRFERKPFVRASTRSLFHVPLNMGPVFTRTMQTIREAGAEAATTLILSHDDSPWHAEHLFSISKTVPGADVEYLTGNFLTKMFEGPYSDAPRWCAEMEEYVQARGRRLEKLFFYYTTCPRCAKHYGKNYVVGIAQVA
jgi:hypothetical protein